MPAIGVRKLMVIVIGAWKAARSSDRDRSYRIATGEQVDLCGSMLQCHAGCVERSGGGADHADRLAVQCAKVDDILGVGVAAGGQMGCQNVRDEPVAAAGKSGRQDDLPDGLGRRPAGRIEMQPE